MSPVVIKIKLKALNISVSVDWITLITFRML